MRGIFLSCLYYVRTRLMFLEQSRWCQHRTRSSSRCRCQQVASQPTTAKDPMGNSRKGKSRRLARVDEEIECRSPQSFSVTLSPGVLWTGRGVSSFGERSLQCCFRFMLDGTLRILSGGSPLFVLDVGRAESSVYMTGRAGSRYRCCFCIFDSTS